MSGGLTRRMVVASGLLALVVSAAFVVLLVSVEDLRATERLALHSEEVLAAATQLERLVIDVESGQRGFVITGQKRFLDSWRDAQRALPGASRRLAQLTADDQEHGQALRIGQAVTAYARDYSVPLVAAAGRDPDSARTVAATDEGRQRIEEEMGDLLFAFANLARKLGIEPESALRKANDKFTKRFTALEDVFHEQGGSVHEATLEQMEEVWEQVKRE